MGSEIRQWLATLTCNICVAMTATCFVWMAPLMVKLTSPGSPVPMTTTDSSWLTASVELGELVSTIPAGLLADRFGRKTVLMSSAPICLLGWILILTTRSIYILYLVRILQGVAIGFAFTVGPMYIAEIAEPGIRGKLSCHLQVMWYVGCIYAYIAGPYLSYDNYIYACSVVPIISIIIFSVVPESPYFYLMVNEEKKAKNALSWLRGDLNVDKEFEAIKSSVNKESPSKGSIKDLFATKKDRKAFFVVQLVSFVKYFGGMTAITLYATQTFQEELGYLFGSDEMTIILGLILIITTFIASFVSDIIGRKPLLITSCVGSAIFNLIIALIYYLDSNTTIDISAYKWVSFICLICFAIVSNIGLSPLMQTIQAEYFPSHTRGIGGGLTEMLVSAFGFINVKQYQMLNDAFGAYMNFLIFSLVATFGTVLFACLIKETAGRSLGQIQETFEEKKRKDLSSNL